MSIVHACKDTCNKKIIKLETSKNIRMHIKERCKLLLTININWS